MIEKVMTEEEQEAFVKKVWDDTQEEIKKQVGYAISQELRMMTGTRTRQIVGRELDPLIKKVIEENQARIVDGLNRVASRLVDTAIENFFGKFTYELQQAMSRAVEDPLHELGSRLSNIMFMTVSNLVEVERKERADEVARRRQEAIAAKKEAPNGG